MRPEDLYNRKFPYRKTNDEPLGVLLKRLVAAYGLGGRLNEMRIRELWGEMMGEAIQKYTRKIFFKDKKLTVYITAAALRQELAYAKEKIKTMMNEELGEGAVEEVFIR